VLIRFFLFFLLFALAPMLKERSLRVLKPEAVLVTKVIEKKNV
jgi:hypothetical protein